MTYTYKANNLPDTKTDARGKATIFTWNTRNLVTGVSYNDGGATPSASYTYDEYSAKTAMTDGEGTMTYYYNGFRQLDHGFMGEAGENDMLELLELLTHCSVDPRIGMAE